MRPNVWSPGVAPLVDTAFPDPLRVDIIAPTVRHRVRLTDDFRFVHDVSPEHEEALSAVGVEFLDGTLTIPSGFVNDLASVPRLLWQILAPWDIPRSSVVHDWLYHCIRRYQATAICRGEVPMLATVHRARLAADDVMRIAMRAGRNPEASAFIAGLVHRCLRLFGARAGNPDSCELSASVECRSIGQIPPSSDPNRWHYGHRAIE